MIELAITRLHVDAVIPGRTYDGDAGLDLASLEQAVLAPGGRATVRTGFAVAIPAGYAGFVQPRSGLAARHGITVLNSPGLIDSGYRGELKVVLINLDIEEPIYINRGDKIAQLVVQRIESVELEVRDVLPPTERGAGGFGSSGR